MVTKVIENLYIEITDAYDRINFQFIIQIYFYTNLFGLENTRIRK